RNPYSPPRAAALKFWEIEIGKPTNQVPTIAEVDTALSSANFRVRWAARNYLEASPVNYQARDLVTRAGTALEAVWAALAMKSNETMQETDPYLTLPFMSRAVNAFTNGLANLDPGLALLTSMELAMEKNDSNIMNVFTNHAFSSAEIAIIKP